MFPCRLVLLVTSITLALAPSLPAQAAAETLSWQQAIAARTKGDYALAADLLADIANAGDANQSIACQAIFMRGNILFENLFKPAEAIECYQQVLARCPDFQQAERLKLNLAQAMMSVGLYHQSLPIFRELAAESASYDFDHRNLDFYIAYCQKKLDELNVELLEKDVRILLADDMDKVTISAINPKAKSMPTLINIMDINGTVLSSDLTSIEIEKHPRGMRVGDGYYLWLKITTNPQAYLNFKGNNYPGWMLLRCTPKGIIVINYVSQDKYLVGVLSKEVSCNWHREVLKAQAVVARTYLVERLWQAVMQGQDKGYDLTSDICSQVYKGAATGSDACKEAVKLTDKTILTYDSVPISAYFHSNNGGISEDARYVWGKPSPYLVVKKDPYSLKLPSGNPGISWSFEITAADLEERLKAGGYDTGKIKDVRIQTYSPSGRAATLRIIGSERNEILNGNKLRLTVGAMDIKSTLFSVRKKGNKFIFKGNGFGHGVGMSQWGAYQMAKEGHSWSEILDFYYPKVLIKSYK